jgi:hypothetical protein
MQFQNDDEFESLTYNTYKWTANEEVVIVTLQNVELLFPENYIVPVKELQHYLKIAVFRMRSTTNPICYLRTQLGNYDTHGEIFDYVKQSDVNAFDCTQEAHEDNQYEFEEDNHDEVDDPRDVLNDILRWTFCIYDMWGGCPNTSVNIVGFINIVNHYRQQLI